MSFSFGTSGSGGSGLFGTSNNTTASSTGGALFSASTKPTPSSSASGSTATTGTSGPSLFGASTGNPPMFGQNKPSASTSSGLFSGTGNTSSAPSLFSTPNKNDASRSVASTPLFGTAGSSGQAGSVFTTSNQGGNAGETGGKPASLFAPSGNFASPNLFPAPSSNQETTKSASTPASMFGSAKASSAAIAATPAPAKTSNLFGLNSTTPAGAPPPTSGPSGQSLFGGGPMASFSLGTGNSMGAGATSASATPSLFGHTNQNTQSAAPSLFPPRGVESKSTSSEGVNPGSDTSLGQDQSRVQINDNSKANSTQSQSQPPKFTLATTTSQSNATANSLNPSFQLNVSSASQTANTGSAPRLFGGGVSNKPTQGGSLFSPKTTGAPASTAPTASTASATPLSTASSTLFGSTSAAAPNTTTDTNVTSASQIPSSTAPATTDNATVSSANGGASASTATASGFVNPSDASKLATNLGNSTNGPKPTLQSRLKNKSMDEIITRWANDLQKYQKEFRSQAEKVADWDKVLVSSSEQIQKLYGSTLEAERATAEIERQLSAVENDQSEIEYWLENYEKQVDDLLVNQGSAASFGEGLQGPDAERERTFKMAERLSDRLTEMGKDLGSMVEEINEASRGLSKGTKEDDPLSQIVRVLNGHLTQLQVIDQGTAALQAKVDAVQGAGRAISNSRTLLSNNSADEFYRSYMGRR